MLTILLGTLALLSTPQVADTEIAGVWLAEFTGRTFIRLELKTVNGTPTGSFTIGNFEVDDQGLVRRADAAPNTPTPIFDVTQRGSAVTFSRKDGDSTDQFILRVIDKGSADLQIVFDEEDRQELEDSGVPLPKPIRLRKAG